MKFIFNSEDDFKCTLQKLVLNCKKKQYKIDVQRGLFVLKCKFCNVNYPYDVVCYQGLEDVILTISKN